jgi:hypothetical protein
MSRYIKDLPGATLLPFEQARLDLACRGYQKARAGFRLLPPSSPLFRSKMEKLREAHRTLCIALRRNQGHHVCDGVRYLPRDGFTDVILQKLTAAPAFKTPEWQERRRKEEGRVTA